MSHSFHSTRHISEPTRPTRKYDLPNRIRILCGSHLWTSFSDLHKADMSRTIFLKSWPSVNLSILRWGPYLQSCLCLWGYNMGKFKLSQIPYPMVHGGNRSLHTYISTLEGPGSISYGQYLDQTLGKFPPSDMDPTF